MRQIALVVALVVAALAAAAATYGVARWPLGTHARAVESKSAVARTAGLETAAVTRRSDPSPSDPPRTTMKPESRVPRGLTTAIVARLVKRTFRSGYVYVKHVSCIAGSPGSGRFGCAYTWHGKCFASLVDMSRGSVDFAGETKVKVPVARCTARAAFT